MLAGKFAAGAAALEGRAAQIDLGLIGLAATTLAFAPDGNIVAARDRPFVDGLQPFGGFGRSGIRRQGQNFCFRC